VLEQFVFEGGRRYKKDRSLFIGGPEVPELW
jgi:hypothetical protein